MVESILVSLYVLKTKKGEKEKRGGTGAGDGGTSHRCDRRCCPSDGPSPRRGKERNGVDNEGEEEGDENVEKGNKEKEKICKS